MAQKTAAPYTTTDITVPYGQKIAISTNGGKIVTIWYQTAPGISPVGFYVHDRIVNEEVELGTFAADQVVRIVTTGSSALYDVGASPSVGSGDADTLKGYSPDATDTADTVALRDGSGDVQANAFESTVATGTAPFTVASTTAVSNLNADTVDGVEASVMARNNVSNTFANDNIYEEGKGVYIKDSGATARPVALISSDVTTYGSTALATNIRSNGTLTYNGASLATGSIDTTATQTITVVDGLITSIV